METRPLAVAVYAVDRASAADGVNTSVRLSVERVAVPGTVVDPALRPSVAPDASGALNVTVTGAVIDAPGSADAGVCADTARAWASCVNTTSTR